MKMSVDCVSRYVIQAYVVNAIKYWKEKMTNLLLLTHYCDVKMGAMAFQITSLTIVYTTFLSGVDQRKHQNTASLAFAREIHRWTVNSRTKGQ